MLLSDFDCNKNEGTIWFLVISVHPGYAELQKQWPDFINSIINCDNSWVYGYDLWPGNQIVPSFSLQWKSDKSTKHFLTQMLLAINWCCWQAGNKFMHVYEGSRSPHVSMLHWKRGYFSNRVVSLQLGFKLTVLVVLSIRKFVVISLLFIF